MWALSEHSHIKKFIERIGKGNIISKLLINRIFLESLVLCKLQIERYLYQKRYIGTVSFLPLVIRVIPRHRFRHHVLQFRF